MTMSSGRGLNEEIDRTISSRRKQRPWISPISLMLHARRGAGLSMFRVPQCLARLRPRAGESPLSRVAPDDLCDAQQSEDRAIDHPVLVADHERFVVRAGEMQPLQGPEASADDHQQAEQAAYD